jgi:hypothetical protein
VRIGIPKQFAYADPNRKLARNLSVLGIVAFLALSVALDMALRRAPSLTRSFSLSEKKGLWESSLRKHQQLFSKPPRLATADELAAAGRCAGNRNTRPAVR